MLGGGNSFQMGESDILFNALPTIKRYKLKADFCEIYLKKIGDVWFSVGFMADGTIRFTAFSKKNAEEALSSGIKSLKPWEKPVKAERGLGEAEKVFRLMDRAYRGLGVKRLPPLTWSRLKPFTRKVLGLTLQIPRGYVTSYGAVAEALDVSRATRAVGLALALNPFPLLIPCHRVIKGDLTLGGYGIGVGIKAEILRREGVGFEKAEGALKIKPEHYLSCEKLKEKVRGKLKVF